MAIVQISKLQVRAGAEPDLPQLDIGELGFATDTQNVYVGNDTSIVPQNGPMPSVTQLVTKISEYAAPTVSSSAGVKGQIYWDANYIYVCTATNTWKRAALATW